MLPDAVSQFSGSEISSESPIHSRYPGSSPFQDDDLSRLLFFGRATEAEALLHKILVEDLVVLYSRSGLGKTSLLNAGILAPLRERGFFPVTCRVYVGDDFPQSDPLESIYVSIEQTIAKALGDGILGEYRQGKKTTLWEYFKTLEIWSPDDILLTPVLIIDQFEELFTLYEGDKRQAFIEQLGDLVRGSIPKSLREQYLQPAEAKPVFPYSETPPRVKILMSLREEYLGHLAELGRDLPAIRKSEFRLTPLQRENAEQAIVGPAGLDESRIVGVAQKGLVNQRISEPFSYDAEKLKEILDFLSNPEESPEVIEQNEVDPTQLQILCQYIEEKVPERLSREPGKEVVVDNKLLPGKTEMRAAIQNFYDKAIEKIQPSNRRKVVDLIENGLISRNNRRLSLAQGDIQDRFHVSPATLHELAKVRLLRPEHRLGDTYYELSHDTLIKPIQDSKKNRQAKKAKKRNIIFAALFIVVAFGIYQAVQANQNLNAARDFNLKATLAAQANKCNESRLYALLALADYASGWNLAEQALVHFAPGRYLREEAWAYGRLIDQPDFPISAALRLPSPVGAVVFSPDGQLLASASDDKDDKTVRLWDVSKHQPLGEPLTGHKDIVNSVAFSPDGRVLASASNDKTVCLWDVATHQLLATLIGHSGVVTSVAFSPDGRLLASGSDDKTVRLWDMASHQFPPQLLATLTGGGGPINSVAFSPDGRLLATGSEDATVRLWDVSTRQSLAPPLSGSNQPVTSVAFSPDSRLLAFGAKDRNVYLWALASGKALATLTGHENTVSSVAFSRDSRVLASGSEDATVRLWDVTTQQPLAILTHEKSVASVAFSPDGRVLASGSADKTVRLWDVTRRQVLPHTEKVAYVAFSPKDGRLLASASADAKVRLWDVSDRQLLATLTGHKDGVNSVAFPPDGRLLASGSDDTTIRLWDVAKHQPLGEPLTGHKERVTSVAFSPDGRTLASASRDKTVRLWDVASRKPLGPPLTGHEGSISSVAFSPDGRLLASASDDRTVRLWDVGARQPLATLTGHYDEVWGVAFSPDGRLLASASKDATVRLWDLGSDHSGDRLQKVSGTILAMGVTNEGSGRQEEYTGTNQPVTKVAFSPDGRFLASASADKTVRLWDVARRNLLATVTGHKGTVYSVAFSPDCRLLASGSEDATVRLWDLAALADPRPWPVRIAEAQRQYRLHLVNGILKPAGGD